MGLFLEKKNIIVVPLTPAGPLMCNNGWHLLNTYYVVGTETGTMLNDLQTSSYANLSKNPFEGHYSPLRI